MSVSSRKRGQKRDYYQVLDVEAGANTPEIKAAYRKLAVRHHPDRNPGDQEAEERFKEAAEAYAVLSDPDKRTRYDRFGHAGMEGIEGMDFSDILGDLFGFSDLFGGRRRGGGNATSGADLRYDLILTFEQAARGHQATLGVPRLETCPTCTGTGSRGGVSPAVCSACGGRGQLRYTQGFFTVARTCGPCGGTGRMVTDPCSDCGGEGRIEMERNLQVTIPAGVDRGSRLRLQGEGEHGLRGGRRGDLYVVIDLEPHAYFHREGAQVFTELEIGYPQAVLGARLEVETLHGPAPLDVPAGAAPGQEFRLRGKGIPRLEGSGRGDHIVRIKLKVPNPRQLSDQELELVRRMAEVSGLPVREERSVLERVRSLL